MTEPIMAYRSWGLTGDGKRLMTTGVGAFIWAPLKAVASQCRTNSSFGAPTLAEVSAGAKGPVELHESPAFKCSCGYYAMKDVAAIPRSSVYGRVALWGHVVECEFGYRAQYAYPQVLFVRPGADDKAKAAVQGVAAEYGCEVATMPDVLVEATKRNPEEEAMTALAESYAKVMREMMQGMGQSGGSSGLQNWHSLQIPSFPPSPIYPQVGNLYENQIPRKQSSLLAAVREIFGLLGG